MFAGGGVLVAAGFVISAFATEFWQLQLCAVVVGIGLGFSGPISAAVIQPWFTKAKGLATGFSLSAVGVGVFIYPLITNALIEHFNQPHCYAQTSDMTGHNEPCSGWRMTMLAEGLYSGVAIILVSLIVRVPRAGEVAQYEEKSETQMEVTIPQASAEKSESSTDETKAGASGEQQVKLSMKEVIRDRAYYSLLLFKFIFAFAYFLFPHMLKSFGIDSGYSASTMAVLSSAMGLANAFARILIGYIGDKMGRVQVLRVNMLVVLVMVVMWPFSASSIIWLWTVTIIYGLNFAPFEMFPPSIVNDFYGKSAPDSQFVLIGLLYAIISPGALFGGVFFGAIYDATKSYVFSMIYAALVMALGLVVLFFMVPTLKSYKQQRTKTTPFVGDAI
jgi:MFS family permease